MKLYFITVFEEYFLKYKILNMHADYETTHAIHQCEQSATAHCLRGFACLAVTHILHWFAQITLLVAGVTLAFVLDTELSE